MECGVPHCAPTNGCVTSLSLEEKRLLFRIHSSFLKRLARTAPQRHGL